MKDVAEAIQELKTYKVFSPNLHTPSIAIRACPVGDKCRSQESELWCGHMTHLCPDNEKYVDFLVDVYIH